VPTPGDIICGDVKLDSLAPASLGAAAFQPVFVARKGDASEPIWLVVIDEEFTPTPMNMSTFMAGANSMRGIRHPALSRVVLVDREIDYCVVGYEALPGAESMADVIAAGSSRKLLSRTAIEAARGLAYLHRREILHGALTPSTVVLWENMPLLWEHGIAALCSPPAYGRRARSLGGDPVAPEVPRGVQLTPAADVFSWGALLASVATGLLGAEGVAAVVDSEVDEGHQAGLFALIREALAPETGKRPRDGTHLLERLLALEDEAPAGRAPDDLSDLARRYLAEMSEVEARSQPKAGGRSESSAARSESSAARSEVSATRRKPPGRAEASGSLGRLQLKKIRASDSEPVTVVRTPKPAEPRPPSPRPDESSAGVPLWQAVSRSSASSPPGAPTLVDEGADTGELAAMGDLGTIEDVTPDVPELPSEADAENELRDAFADLTRAADEQIREKKEKSGVLDASQTRRSPQRAGTPAAADHEDSAPMDIVLVDVTPVPTRPPDQDAVPSSGGWIRSADSGEGELDPATLPPAQDYGDGVRKRTFEVGAPQGQVDDPTPRDPTPAEGTPRGAATQTTSGLARIRNLWRGKGKGPAAEAEPPAPPTAKPASEPPVPPPPQAASKPPPKAAARKAPTAPAAKAKPAPARVPVDTELPPDIGVPEAIPFADLSPRPPSGPPPEHGRAKPVAPFVAPRSPGPHGPRGSWAAAVVIVVATVVPALATMRAAAQRGGIDRVFLGAAKAKAADDAPAPTPEAQPTTGCPAGSVALPSEAAPDESTAFVCIDVAEFPGLGEMPTTDIEFVAAEEACESNGRRLCSTEEWMLACTGLSGRKYPYGDKREREHCPSQSKGELSASGAHAACVSPEGVFDLVGNAAEWVAEGTALGGSVTTRAASCKTKLRPGKRAKRAGVGFRCCVDVVP